MMCLFLYFFFFKQKTAYELRISDWSSDVCPSDLNGYGQSTICAVLRSAATQSPQLISEREHLGKAGIPAATIQFAPSKTVAFNNGSWNCSPPPILLFDQEYVKTHIHVAEEVTTDNRRRMLRVIIGSTGVELARQLDALETENAALNVEIRTLEAAIRKAGPDIRDKIGRAHV